MNKPQNIITVIGRRWFEKTNGNTYHSVEVYVNGEFLDKVSFAYGYGSHYTQTALEILYKHGVYERKDDNSMLWHIVKSDHNDLLIDSVTDVMRKKDL